METFFVASTLILGVEIFQTYPFQKIVNYFQESRIALFLIVAIYESALIESKPTKIIPKNQCFNFILTFSEITYEETTLNGEYQKTKTIMSRNQTSNNCPELNEDTSSIVVYNPRNSGYKIEPKYEIEPISHRERLIETNGFGNFFMGDENVIVLNRSKRGIDYEVLKRRSMDDNNEAMALEQLRQSKALGSGQYTHDIYRRK